MFNPYKIIKRPILTEKSNLLREKQNKYTFIVSKDSSKGDIKNAIKELFKVDVVKVNTAIISGKLRRLGAHSGFKPDWKKATVTVKKGQSIKIAEGI